MGVPPEPTRKRDIEFFDGELFELPCHDPDFERRHQEWVNNLTTEQQEIYNNYLLAAREWALAGEEDLEKMRASSYEALGLEFRVNTEAEYTAARNRAKLFAMLDRVRLDAGGREANDQLEQFFRRRSET